MTFLGNIVTDTGAGSSGQLLVRIQDGRPLADNSSTRSAYDTIDVGFEPRTGTYWCRMEPQGRPVMTATLLRDLSLMQDSLPAFAKDAASVGHPMSYFVLASKMPGVFNLGGDLRHFIEGVRHGDRVAIQTYARKCVEVVYRNLTVYNLPIITCALVQGDALGGGFETALSFDVIVAERSAKMGLPEVLFNLFPGMGAYSVLSRRLDAVRAERLIMSGKIHTAEELHAMGLVDVLAEDGQGEAAVRDYIEKNKHKHNAHAAIYRTRRRVNPITWDELRDVVDIWVDAVFNLTEADLNKMARLTSAQDRRTRRTASLVAAG